jgi:hypothetical protein
VRFPYVTLRNAAPRPYLNVVLRVGYRTSDIIKALVDSGADYPIFDMEVAKGYLNIDLRDAELWNFSGTTGEIQQAGLAKVSLTILNPNGIDEACEIDTVCGFCDTFNFAGGALLGQKGFFSKFKATFYQPQGYFEIEQFAPPQNGLLTASRSA